MLVQDVMTSDPATVTGDSKVKQTVILAAERQVSSLPVVDAQGRICGIVTDADLVRDAFPHDPRAHEKPQRDADRAPAVLVREVMTSPAVTVGVHDDLADVVALMTSSHLKSLPVVDTEGRVLGMVSRSDVLRVRARPDDLLHQEVADVLREVGHPEWQATVSDGVVTISGATTTLDRSIATWQPTPWPEWSRFIPADPGGQCSR